MIYLKKFNELGKNDVGMAGGKGASLGEMTQVGIPVPPGFVILANAFKKLISDNQIAEKIDKILKKIDPAKTETVNRGSAEIRVLFNKTQISQDIADEIIKAFDNLGAEFVAVRSSATAEDSSSTSWAGELETYLNVSKDRIIETVKKCWSSLFTPRAIFYRIEKKMHTEDVSVAVVVQKMLDPDISGITFTVHPVTKDKNSMVVEAGWGLGEAIVGGRIIPDTYVVDKEKMSVIKKFLNAQKKMIKRINNETKEIAVPEDKKEKPKLTDQDILRLAQLCKKIEKHYGKPQDIEWAVENNQFYILQARPITTL